MKERITRCRKVVGLAALLPAVLMLATTSCNKSKMGHTSEGSTMAGGLGPAVAHAILEGRSGSHLKGSATFISTSDGVRIEVHVSGVAPGTHAVHLHANPDCSAPDATSAGPHFDTDAHAHGAPTANPHHSGDFGNMQVGSDSTGTLELVSKDLTVGPGPGSVLGHSLVVHGGTDDYTTQPAGNSGPRIGCGVVIAGP